MKTFKNFKTFKKIMLTAMSIALLETTAIAGNKAESFWNLNHEKGGYCEKIDYKDAYNCLDPARRLSKNFCLTQKAGDARVMCLDWLKKSITNEISELHRTAEEILSDRAGRWPDSEYNEETKEYNTASAYCAAVYWEDKDNCYYDTQNSNSCLYDKNDEACEPVTADFCGSIPEKFKIVREECFKQLKQQNFHYQKN